MMDHLKGHLKHMLIGGAVILVVLLAFGVDLGKALPYAMLLACPLMMVWMMASMNKGKGHSHGHGQDHGLKDAPVDIVDAQPTSTTTREYHDPR